MDFFNEFGSLFNIFGWWTIAFIVGLTMVMIPVNLLWKKVMKKEKLDRLRKTTSSLSVYVLALGAVAAFTAITHNHILLDFNYLAASTLSLGFCSQALWVVIKFVKEYGLSAIKALAEGNDWKKVIKDVVKVYNLDSKLTNVIITKIETYLDGIDGDNAQIFLDNEVKILNDLKSKLTGFIESEKVSDTATGIVNKIKETLIKPAKTKTETK